MQNVQREALSAWVTAVLLLLLLTYYFHLAHTSKRRTLNQASCPYLHGSREAGEGANLNGQKKQTANAAD